MRTAKKPPTTMDVTRAMAGIESNLKELVSRLGDPDEAIADEANRAFLQIDELIANALASGIRRPRSPRHRVRASLAALFVRSRNTLPAQLALLEVEKREKDQAIVDLASAVLLELTLDEVENRVLESRRLLLISKGRLCADAMSYSERQMSLVKERLAELRAKE